MQIVERNSFGVRAAVYRLERPGEALEFELFPMVHIGEQIFYDAVRARLEQCDLVLFEGVVSASGALLSWSYRLIAKRKRLGLVCQQDALPIRRPTAKWIHADVSTAEFDDTWRRVPRWDRWLLSIVMPFRGVWGYLTATRASIADRIGIDDLTSRDDAFLMEELPEVMDAIRTRRDGHLLACVLRAHDERAGQRARVGVLYGAAHLPPVLRLLQDRLGYRVKTAEWLTVFEI